MLIPLSQGKFAIIDDCDYERVSQYKWYASFNPATQSFYAVRSVYLGGGRANPKIKSIRLSRFIHGLEPDDPREVDHKNHDTLDDTRKNHRIVTKGQNAINRRRYKSNSSGLKGVYWKYGRNKSYGYWKAVIQVNKKRVSLGSFDTKEDAYRAYIEAANRLHGEFACYA